MDMISIAYGYDILAAGYHISAVGYDILVKYKCHMRVHSKPTTEGTSRADGCDHVRGPT